MAESVRKWATWRVLLFVGGAMFFSGSVWDAVTPDFGSPGLSFEENRQVMGTEAAIWKLEMFGVFLAFIGAILHPAVRRWSLGLVREGAAASASGIKQGLDPRPAAERLAELEELRRKGLIAEEEYARKRSEIIDGL